MRLTWCLDSINLRVLLPCEYLGLFGWLIQPDSASHNSIFLSREISQPFSQQYFPLTRNQPAIQPASQPNKPQEPRARRASPPRAGGSPQARSASHAVFSMCDVCVSIVSSGKYGTGLFFFWPVLDSRPARFRESVWAWAFRLDWA